MSAQDGIGDSGGEVDIMMMMVLVAIGVLVMVPVEGLSPLLDYRP